jgi:hypothetical protein
LNDEGKLRRKQSKPKSTPTPQKRHSTLDVESRVDVPKGEFWIPQQVPLLSGIKNGVRGRSMMVLDKLT